MIKIRHKFRLFLLTLSRILISFVLKKVSKEPYVGDSKYYSDAILYCEVAIFDISDAYSNLKNYYFGSK